MTPSIWQIVIVVLLVLVIFGAGRIPSMMGDMAKGIKAFKNGIKDEDLTGHKSDNKNRL